MCIDLSLERPISFNDAAKMLPDGKRPAYATWWRWRRVGIRGVKLETILIGGRRFTSAEAVQRFISATTAAADGAAPTVRTPRRRRLEQAQARDVLHHAGIATDKGTAKRGN